MTVLQRSGEIGVSGYHPGVNLSVNVVTHRPGGHRVGPIDEIPVFDPHRDRRAERDPVPDAAKNFRPVFFDFHAAAAAIPALAASEVRCDVLLGNRQSCGHAFDDEGQPSSMGLTGGQESEHWYSGRSCLTCGRRLVGISDV